MMNEFKIVERTLYTPILNLLGDLGFQGVQEIKRGNDYLDIIFKVEGHIFIVEIKIDAKGKKQIIDGIVQAYRYSLNEGLRTQNIISICYPPDVAKEIITLSEVSEKALKRRVECILLTENWYDYVTDLSIEDIFNNLKAKIDKKILAAKNIQTASKTIQKAIKHLSILINNSYTDSENNIQKLANYLGKDYGLLTTFNKSKTNKILRNQVIDLLAYVLVNQILFYFLYAKKTNAISEINEIQSLSDLDIYFNQIREINFKPIFDIKVNSKILGTPEIIEWINTIIMCLTPLRIDEIKHDLYGRLIGSSIPKETRKTLASYYTNTSSADLLTNLTIDEYDNTVWDLACGSGTILVSAYNRKLKLYEMLKRDLSSDDKKKLHTIFLENQITGIDIMPFACHLTGLNLSAQNLESLTNHMRIVNENSLKLFNLPMEVNEAYGEIYKDLESIEPSQKTIDAFGNKEVEIKTIPSKITLDKVDRVLINPPFTRLTNIPEKFRKVFDESALSDICGKRIHLWGYFLSLADKVLIDGGKFGAIVPSSILRGKDAETVRKYFLENYSIEYIIKPDFNLSFSEDSNFGDIIFIAKKNKPAPNHDVKIVCLKNDISHCSSVDVDNLTSQIKIETDILSNKSEYLSRKVKQTELLDNYWNLMPYIFTNNEKCIKKFDKIIDKMKKNPHFIQPRENGIRDGIQLRPRGEAKKRIITRNLSNNRVLKANLIFNQDNDEKFIYYYDKKTDQHLKIDKAKVIKSFRTITSVNKLDISEIHDYFIKEEYNVVFSHLIIANRYRLNSNETHGIAFYHDEGVFPTNSFIMFMNLNRDFSKILVLYFNSIFYLIQLLRMRKQATRGFLEIKQVDIYNTYIPLLNKINDEDIKKMLLLFDTFNGNLTAIKTQFEEKNPERIDFDYTISKIFNLGIKKEEILKIYDLILFEINNFEKNIND